MLAAYEGFDMDGLDEAERLSLEQSIAQIETVIAQSTASIGSSMTSMLVRFVENAKQRIGHLDNDHHALADEKRKQGAQELAIAHLVEQEIALNQAEREQYGAFLAKDFFTKTDFDDLEGFYSNTWDRLSEGGKAQMSHRVWEGVRRDEYKFSELPDTVKDKEAGRLRELLSRSRRSPSELAAIPERDRDDFVIAWDAGEKRRSFEVLDRPAFAEHVAKTSSVISTADETNRQKGAESQIVKSETTREDLKKPVTPQSGGKSDATLSTDFLASLQEVDDKPVALLAAGKSDVPKAR